MLPAGEWGTKIVFFKPITKVKKDDNGKDKKDQYLVLREYTVFNLDQVEGAGLDSYRVRPGSQSTPVDYRHVEEVIAATKADIRFGGNQAVYHRPPQDFIECPPEVFHLVWSSPSPGGTILPPPGRPVLSWP